MRLGLQKTSLLDYPGRVSTVLFTAGCNFRCPYCQNPELVLPSFSQADHLMTCEQALAFLGTRRGLVSAVVVSGGEPTLHDGLPGLVGKLHAMGFLVKLDTNGSNPERIHGIGADYIALDIKTDPGRYHELWPDAPPDASDRIMQSVKRVRESGAGYELRITCAPGFINIDDAMAISRLLVPADTVFLQRYHPGTVLDPSWAAGVSPYPDDFMDSLLAIIKEAAPLARIRGW